MRSSHIILNVTSGYIDRSGINKNSGADDTRNYMKLNIFLKFEISSFKNLSFFFPNVSLFTCI